MSESASSSVDSLPASSLRRKRASSEGSDNPSVRKRPRTSSLSPSDNRGGHNKITTKQRVKSLNDNLKPEVLERYGGPVFKVVPLTGFSSLFLQTDKLRRNIL